MCIFLVGLYLFTGLFFLRNKYTRNAHYNTALLKFFGPIFLSVYSLQNNCPQKLQAISIIHRENDVDFYKNVNIFEEKKNLFDFSKNAHASWKCNLALPFVCLDWIAIKLSASFHVSKQILKRFLLVKIVHARLRILFFTIFLDI